MWEEIQEYIKMKDLKDAYVYEIKAPQANYCVWVENKKAFMISRWKFSSNYLFLELHWDEDAQHGTAKPIKIVDKFNFELRAIDKYNENETKEILSHLDSLDKSLKGVVHKGFDEIQQDKINTFKQKNLKKDMHNGI